MRARDLPLRKTMCRTCPFRACSPYADLALALAKSAMSDGSRICHSTGSNGLNGRTGVKSHLCRGARQVQLTCMHRLGVLESPTDKAWNKQRVVSGMKPTEVKDPC